jgi:hypothetical protein
VSCPVYPSKVIALGKKLGGFEKISPSVFSEFVKIQYRGNRKTIEIRMAKMFQIMGVTDFF